MELKNQADALIHQTEKTLSDGGDKVSAQDKGEAEAAVSAARTAMEGSDAAGLKSATERLSQVAMRVGEAMYKAQADAAGAAAPGAAPGGGSAGGSDHVVDAEFEEVDDRKKSA